MAAPSPGFPAQNFILVETFLRKTIDSTLADLLILDELSYLSFNRHQSELLFKVISDRSEKGSTIVTTNLPFSQLQSN